MRFLMVRRGLEYFLCLEGHPKDRDGEGGLDVLLRGPEGLEAEFLNVRTMVTCSTAHNFHN